MMAQRARPLHLTALFRALTALKFAHAATAPAPAPAVEVSATLPQSLGAFCVSPQGICNFDASSNFSFKSTRQGRSEHLDSGQPDEQRLFAKHHQRKTLCLEWP